MPVRDRDAAGKINSVSPGRNVMVEHGVFGAIGFLKGKTCDGFGFIGDTDKYYRSWDEATHDVYMIDANTIYGKVVDSNGFTTTSGQQYINNDITLPYGVTDDDKLTYVKDIYLYYEIILAQVIYICQIILIRAFIAYMLKTGIKGICIC